MKGLGTLVVQLTYNPDRITGAHLSIPLLALSEHLLTVSRFDRIPAGEYEGVLTTHLLSGKQFQHKMKFKILPDQENRYECDLSRLPQILKIRPVGAGDHPIIPCEIMVTGVDSTFRSVKDPEGIQYVLRPAKYTVRITLPNCRMVTLPLQVIEGVHTYLLPVEEEEHQQTPTRREVRYEMAVPVALKTTEGDWIPSRSTNLSTMGLCCQYKGEQRITDKELFVRLFVPISRVPLECNAKVCWTHIEGTSVPSVGLELHLPGSDRTSLGKWLNHKLQRP